jgi:ABC-type antimicrobial peptide transport system permease subunit
MIYTSLYVVPQYAKGLMARASGDPGAIAEAVRIAVERTEPRLPITGLNTVASRLSNTLRNDRLLLRLTADFGLLALLLAAVGLYGVLSYRIARRTNEIGVRMAIGARYKDILLLSLRDGVSLTFAGIAAGALAAPAAARWISDLLYQTPIWQPSILLTAAGTLLLAAVAAALAPSLRAARVNPVEALRQE